MTKFYLATVTAIIITATIASHVLATGVLGAATPRFLSLWSGAGEYFSRFRGLCSDWVAAARRHRERRSAIFELSSLNDRELKDMGLYRSTIAHTPGSSSESPEADRRLR